MADVKKIMMELTQSEKELLADEKEEEYLKLQKELLEVCEKENSPQCEKKDIDWNTLTEKLTTLNITTKKS